MKTTVRWPVAIAIVATIAFQGCGAGLPPGASTQALVSVNVSLDEVYSSYAGRDGVPPVYEPWFLTAEHAGLDDDDVVVGFVFRGESHAYPLRILLRRGMVNDEVGGLPVLVSW